jgi:hypothetical protein
VLVSVVSLLIVNIVWFQHRFECPLKKEKVYRCKYCTFKTFKKAAHNKHMEKLHMKRPSDKNMTEKEK